MSDSAIDLSVFTAMTGDTVIIAPCLALSIFLDVTDDGGLIDFYDRCRDALGDRLTHYQAESMKRFAPLDPRGDAMVKTWFGQPRRGKADYYLQMSAGDPDQAVTASLIEMHVQRRPAAEWTPEVEAGELAKRRKAFDERRFIAPHLATTLRLTLPLDHPLAEPGAFRDWALGFELLKAGTVFSAYGGYGLNYYRQAARPTLYGPMQPTLASFCLRYPGFDWDGGGLRPRLLRYRPGLPAFLPMVKRASWLNVVCDRTLEVMGGREAVRAALQEGPEAIAVQDMAHGLAISAGPAPRTGDIGHRDFLPAYRQVARVLRPVRIDDIDGLGAGFMAAKTNEWLDAFDRTYD